VKGTLATAAAFAVVLFVVFVMFKGFGNDPHAVPFLLTGKPAPAFHMKRLDTDEMVTLETFMGKKPIVLNFWATWCGPCKLEHPTLKWAGERYKDDVIFLGVVFEDTEENTKKFLRENGTPFTQLFDLKSTVAVDYAVSGVPETYFINRQGIIVGKYAAPIDPQTMDERIREILK
jgi:cytochrome c biogenesis protein CcmG/thiol:disulfide interchange protein DsbE